MDEYINIASSNALSYKQAFKLAKQRKSELEVDDDWYPGQAEQFAGFSYQGDHGEQCYVDFKDAYKTFKMNPATGSVETEKDWIAESKQWEGDVSAQLASLVEVVRINDEWVEA